MTNSVTVGILSMQRISNYGSFLQAYALKNILIELGCDVRFIDYQPGPCLELANSANKKGTLQKVLEAFNLNAGLFNTFAYLKYKKYFKDKYLPILGVTSEHNEKTNDLDLLVIGSDEVFNCIQSNPDVGYTPMLFGCGSESRRTISYAGSFGNTTLEALQKNNVSEEIAKWLSSLDSLSVRDDNSRFIASSLGISDVDIHLDPALIFDYKNFIDGLEIPKPSDAPFLILYGYTGRFSKHECNEIRRYARKKNLIIVNIGGLQYCCDKFVDCNPFEVINYFRYADSVITDTFHGTIFSIVENKPFVSLVRTSGYSNSNKLLDLLKRLGLEQRAITNNLDLDLIDQKPVDYLSVNKILKSERRKSYSYLKEEVKKYIQN